MSRFPNARFFYRAYWGERVKWSALSPLRLSAIFFVVKHAFGRNRCVLYVSINATFLLLKFTLWSSKAYFGYLLHKNPTAFNGSQYLTRGIETEISMVVRILPWFWCCDILGHENNFYHGYKKKTSLTQWWRPPSIGNRHSKPRRVANMQNCCCWRREQWLRTKGHC